jgi:hypothetical protein
MVDDVIRLEWVMSGSNDALGGPGGRAPWWGVKGGEAPLQKQDEIKGVQGAKPLVGGRRGAKPSCNHIFRIYKLPAPYRYSQKFNRLVFLNFFFKSAIINTGIDTNEYR